MKEVKAVMEMGYMINLKFDIKGYKDVKRESGTDIEIYTE